MKDYHPGRGVYRSSYMNALRVGATETNIAYHEADHQRWNALDFVLGVKVERSGTSALPCPVCDAMQGTYPKGFKFLPWHPFCICHATPVMLSGDEFTEYLATGRMPQGRVLRDMPPGALAYVEQHPSYRTSYSYLHNVPFFKTGMAERIETMRVRRKQIQREASTSIKGTTITNEEFGMPVRVTGRGIKEWLNQPHAHYREKNEALLHIDEILQEARYLGFGRDRHDVTMKAHFFEVEVAGEKSWVIAREDPTGTINLYSISDSNKVLSILKQETTQER